MNTNVDLNNRNIETTIQCQNLDPFDPGVDLKVSNSVPFIADRNLLQDLFQ